MKVYKKIMDGLAMIEKVILSVITVVVTVVTFANVVVRYASDSQFAWSEELVINLFVLMIMMGCALCAREGSLISLSLIFDFLKVKGKKIFVAIITVVNCAVLRRAAVHRLAEGSQPDGKRQAYLFSELA